MIMASQYDEIQEQANAMRQFIASNQTIASPARQKTSDMLAAVATAKQRLASAQQNTAKAIHEADLMKSNTAKVERPFMAQNTKTAKKKILF